MLEVTGPYVDALAPHIYTRDSIPKRYWGQTAALAPVFLIACFTGKLELLRILLLCLVSAVAWEFLAAKFFDKKEHLKNGEAVLMAVLFALLMPPGCPAELIMLGNFPAVFLFKEAFGGTGSYLFHPVLLARALLQTSFPAIMTEPLILGSGDAGWVLGAFAASAILLLKQKQGYWETPALYAALCIAGMALRSTEVNPTVFSSGVLLASFFLLADPVPMPLTRKGTRVFVSGAALLTVLLGRQGFSVNAACYAILSMSVLAPWLDLWIRPSGCRRGTVVCKLKK